MWEPVGPLPAAVYWRRRALAAAVALGAVAMTGTLLTGAAPDPEPAPPPEPVPVAPPADTVPQCTDQMIDVAAGTDATEHEVGAKPVLRLIVTNTSPRPCVRDVDPTRQEITVWSADLRERVWSSNDCSNGGPRADERTLQPNQPLAFPVRWAGRTSAPGCPADRTDVPAGAYAVRARLDTLLGEPTPFTRVP